MRRAVDRTVIRPNGPSNGGSPPPTASAPSRMSTRYAGDAPRSGQEGPPRASARRTWPPDHPRPAARDKQRANFPPKLALARAQKRRALPHGPAFAPFGGRPRQRRRRSRPSMLETTRPCQIGAEREARAAKGARPTYIRAENWPRPRRRPRWPRRSPPRSLPPQAAATFGGNDKRDQRPPRQAARRAITSCSPPRRRREPPPADEGAGSRPPPSRRRAARTIGRPHSSRPRGARAKTTPSSKAAGRRRPASTASDVARKEPRDPPPRQAARDTRIVKAAGRPPSGAGKRLRDKSPPRRPPSPSFGLPAPFKSKARNQSLPPTPASKLSDEYRRDTSTFDRRTERNRRKEAPCRVHKGQAPSSDQGAPRRRETRRHHRPSERRKATTPTRPFRRGQIVRPNAPNPRRSWQ